MEYHLPGCLATFYSRFLETLGTTDGINAINLYYHVWL